MEFPDLGEHCSERTCKQLDFLLLKCDVCGGVFCKDHITYSWHRCSSAFKKDVQVPVCPLCNAPIPVKKREMASIVVGSHMDKGCQPDSAWRKEKVLTDKCFRPSCKKKEMMKLVCDQCHQNVCLQHQHPLDHECPGQSQSISKAGCAAQMRLLEPRQKSLNCQLLHNRCRTKS